jgi:hypothetical protein
MAMMWKYLATGLLAAVAVVTGSAATRAAPRAAPHFRGTSGFHSSLRHFGRLDRREDRFERRLTIRRFDRHEDRLDNRFRFGRFDRREDRFERRFPVRRFDRREDRFESRFPFTHFDRREDRFERRFWFGGNEHRSPAGMGLATPTTAGPLTLRFAAFGE